MKRIERKKLVCKTNRIENQKLLETLLLSKIKLKYICVHVV